MARAATESGASNSAAGIIAEAEATETQPQAAAAETAPGGGGAQEAGAQAEPEEGHTPQELSELEQFFSDGEETPDDSGAQQEGEQSGSRVEKRIRSLAARNREQREHIARMQQEHRAQVDALEQRHHDRHMQLLQEMRRFAPQTQQENNDPVHAFKREVLSEAQRALAGAYGPQIQAMQRELEAFKQQQQQQTEFARRRSNAQRLNQSVDAAVEEVILPSVGGTADRAQKDRLARMVLMVSHSEQLAPVEAAKVVRATLNGYARGSIRHGYKARGDKLRESQQAAEPTPPGRSGASGESYPDWSLITKHGYRSYHQWQMAGRPALF